MFSVDILISTSKKMLTPTEDMSDSAWPMLLTWSFLVLFDNLGFFCPIVELWPVLNPPNVVVDVTFGLIYLVTFKKVYLKAAAFVRYQILILHWYHLDPPAECPGRQEPCQLSTLHVSGSGTWHSSSLGHVSTQTLASTGRVAPGRSSGGSPRPPSTTRRPCRSRVRAWRSPPPGAAPTPGWGGHGDLASYHALMHLSRPTNWLYEL